MITRTYVGLHPVTGEPYYSYVSDGHVMLTGKATGDLTLADGTVYNVDREVVEIQCADPTRESCAGEPDCHSDELAHHIAVHFEETGILDVPAEESPTGEPIPWLHEPCAHCPEV